MLKVLGFSSEDIKRAKMILGIDDVEGIVRQMTNNIIENMLRKINEEV